MWLTNRERAAVVDQLKQYGIPTENPGETVDQAIAAIVLGQGGDSAYNVASPAVHWVTPYIWMRKDLDVDATLARRIIEKAIEDETSDLEAVPEDDEKAVEAASELIQMAQDAWDNNIRGAEIEAVLNLAAEAEDGDAPAAASEPEPEPEAPAANEEPWENYDSDKVVDIIEGIEVWAESEQWDDIALVLVYEQANKNRVRIVSTAEKLLPDEVLGNLSMKTPAQPLPDDEPAAEPEPDPGEEEMRAREEPPSEPFEGYDELKIVEIVKAMDDYLVNDEVEDTDKLTVIKQVFDYEALNKTRSRLLDYLDTKKEIYGGEEEPSAAQAGAGEDEEPAASEPEPGDEDGAEAGEEGGEETGPAPGEGEAGDGEPDSDHDELLSVVHDLIAREKLHVPPQIEADPIELPYDLTTVSDKQLQKLFSAFNAYSYRTGYLLMVEEAAEMKCREAADEIVQAYIASSSSEDADTVTQLKAQAEQHPEVHRWRRHQKRHGILGSSLRKERDSYDKVCERLSRLETMRHDEFERSGGGGTAKPAGRPRRTG